MQKNLHFIVRRLYFNEYPIVLTNTPHNFNESKKSPSTEGANTSERKALSITNYEFYAQKGKDTPKKQ